MEPGEGIGDALRRELLEELGIYVEAHEPLIRVPHRYPDRTVLLDVRRVIRYRGTPSAREGQPMRWLRPDELRPEVFPAADRPVISALRLPDRYLITGSDPTNVPMFIRRLEAALAGGVRLVQLRAPELETADFRGLARAVAGVCRRYRARLVLNRSPQEVEGFDGVGLHLDSARLMAIQARPAAEAVLVGASCHSAGELEKAAELGLDYALLSPVMPTASHPQAQPLGWPQFAKLVEAVALPVYALGGMQAKDIEVAKRHGAQGIAAIRGLWPADRS